MGGESQDHGKIWEKELQTNCFLMTEEEIKGYKYNAKYDISSGHTGKCEYCSGMNISIKTSGGGRIDCGDIIRFLSSEDTKLVCILYEQEYDNKIATKTICFNINDFIVSLQSRLKINYEEWIENIKNYDSYVKSIPKGKCDKIKYPYKEKKKELCVKYFNIAPKVDSKGQRRVQCSISMDGVKGLPSYKEFEGGKFYDKEYKKTIYSPVRSRNGITINKLKELAKENNIQGPGKRGGWIGFKKKDYIHYLEEKGVSIP